MMKATCWKGPNTVEVEEVPDPKIINARDAIVKITSTAICGSDLHLLQAYVPAMMPGDVLGHEFMGEVVEVGSQVKTLKAGDRVVVPFPIACGVCSACQKGMYSLCENSNPNAWMAEKLWGHSGAGIFGYSHLTGGFAGGQAEYVRVPFADVGPLKVPDGMSDEQALFLSDILPTGYMGAEMCDIQPGDVIAVWGCGPVGQFAIASAFMRGAGHRHRSLPLPTADGARQGRRRDDQLRGGRRHRRAERDDGWPRSRRLHRCSRNGSSRTRSNVRLRPGHAR